MNTNIMLPTSGINGNKMNNEPKWEIIFILVFLSLVYGYLKYKGVW